MHSMRFGGSEFVNSARWFVGLQPDSPAQQQLLQRPGSAGRRVGGCGLQTHALP